MKVYHHYQYQLKEHLYQAYYYRYYYLYDNFNGVVLGVFKLLPPYPFLIYLNAALLLIGVLVGIVGSWISVTRSIRRTR